MVLTDIVVENYQSLKDAKIRLGWFTVITGPTGAGKSALIRAAGHGAFNSRGKDYITHGAKTCKVALGSQDEGWATGLERGTRGADKYILSVPGGEPQTYTKLGGKVPEDVSRLVNLSELNFTSQEDPPYLLDASGGQVAKTLGELTNVTVVLNAAAGATRRKNALGAQLRSAAGDVTRLEAEAGQYADLEAEAQRVGHAEEALARAQSAAERAARLVSLLAAFSAALSAREAARAALDALTPPGTTAMDESLSRLERARKLYLTMTGALEERAHFEQVCQAAARDELVAEAELHAVLVEAGTCPVCGQPTADVAVRA